MEILGERRAARVLAEPPVDPAYADITNGDFRPGAYAERLCVHERQVLAVPPELGRVQDRHSQLWARALAEFERCSGTMGGPAHVDLLYHLVKHRRPAEVVETGVAAGWSSLAILAGLWMGDRKRRLKVRSLT